MSEESTPPDLAEIIRGTFEASDRDCDLDAFLSYAAPDVVSDLSRMALGPTGVTLRFARSLKPSKPWGWRGRRCRGGSVELIRAAYEEGILTEPSAGPHVVMELKRVKLGCPRAKASFAALACVVCACLITPALAAARVDDVAATRAYLRAGDTFERTASNHVATSVAAIDARANEIAGGCPSALTYAPRDAAFGELGEEVGQAAFYAGALPIRPTLLREAGAIEHLTWSDRELTRLVHTEAAEERSIAALTFPAVCADIAAWRASAYATLPQSSMQYLARVQRIESTSFVGPSEESREAVIARLLRRYEGPSERRTAQRIHRLEAQNEKRLGAAATAAQAKMAGALGVSTL